MAKPRVLAPLIAALLVALAALAIGATDGWSPKRFESLAAAGIYRAAPATMVDGEYDVVHLDNNGRQLVNVAAMPAAAAATQVQGTAAVGAAPVGNPVQIGGSDGAAMRIVRMAADGTVRTDPTGTTAQPVTDNAGSLTIDAAELTTLAGPVTAARVATNPIAGQAGLAGGTGVAAANAPRVVVATDDVVSTNLVTLGGTVTAARAAVNPIAGQAGVQGAAGASTALTQRVALATDANAVQQGAGAGAASPWAVRVTNDGAAFATVATDRTTAAAPFAVRITDGTSFGTPGIPLGSEVGTNRITPVTSTGAVAATLVAATAAQVIYPTTLVATNEHATTDYTVEILSSTGPVVLLRYYLPAKTTFVLDLRGDVRTDASDALQYRLTGAGTDVRVSGSAVKR